MFWNIQNFQNLRAAKFVWKIQKMSLNIIFFKTECFETFKIFKTYVLSNSFGAFGKCHWISYFSEQNVLKHSKFSKLTCCQIRLENSENVIEYHIFQNRMLWNIQNFQNLRATKFVWRIQKRSLNIIFFRTECFETFKIFKNYVLPNSFREFIKCHWKSYFSEQNVLKHSKFSKLTCYQIRLENSENVIEYHIFQNRMFWNIQNFQNLRAAKFVWRIYKMSLNIIFFRTECFETFKIFETYVLSNSFGAFRKCHWTSYFFRVLSRSRLAKNIGFGISMSLYDGKGPYDEIFMKIKSVTESFGGRYSKESSHWKKKLVTL
jgi:hypothetical protein